jgi:hypothetical protein
MTSPEQSHLDPSATPGLAEAHAVFGDQAVDFLSVVVKCPSPKGNEAEGTLGDLLADEMHPEVGLQVLKLVKENITEGDNFEKALRGALGTAAVRGDDGRLMRREATEHPMSTALHNAAEATHSDLKKNGDGALAKNG